MPLSTNLTNMEFLITGGAGSLGQTLTKLLLTEYRPKGIRIYSRDEGKHWLLKQKIDKWKEESATHIKTPVSFCIGDLRDEGRLSLAMSGVDVVVHAGAMKQIGTCEENPIEAIQTNIIGTQNVITASLKNSSVKKVFNIGTDKDCFPTTLYGGTKFVAEKLIIDANVYSQGKERRPQFYSFRYGNIIGSKGSVVQLFREQMKSGELTITDPNMTRFWITIQKVARFITFCISSSLENKEGFRGGEVFIPQMPSASILEIANIISPESSKVITGIRKNEKLHEMMIHPIESLSAEVRDLPSSLRKEGMKNFFIIHPNKKIHDEGFSYSSYGNPWKLDKDTLEKWVNEQYAY